MTSTHGPDWLRAFLRDHGITEPAARILWTLGMRESGGTPDLIASGVTQHLTLDQIDPNSSAQRYDVGLWQINSSHLQEVKRALGPTANMATLLNPDANLAYVRHLSRDFTDWTPWGLKPDGYTFDWSDYPPDYVAQWGERIEANHRRIWDSYTAPTAHKLRARIAALREQRRQAKAAGQPVDGIASRIRRLRERLRKQ